MSWLLRALLLANAAHATAVFAEYFLLDLLCYEVIPDGTLNAYVTSIQFNLCVPGISSTTYFCSSEWDMGAGNADGGPVGDVSTYMDTPNCWTSCRDESMYFRIIPGSLTGIATFDLEFMMLTIENEGIYEVSSLGNLTASEIQAGWSYQNVFDPPGLLQYTSDDYYNFTGIPAPSHWPGRTCTFTQ